MILKLKWISSSRVLAVFDTYAAIINVSDGTESARYDYGGATLQSVSISGRSTALLLAVGAAVVVALALAGVVKELLAFLGELGSASGVSADLFVPLYKTIGIALVVQVGGNLCRDAGESALASVVETAGTLCALLAALPLLRAVLDMLLELMG